MRKRSRQLVMTFGWGGWRPGAGRKTKRGGNRRVPHRSRPVVRTRYPLHVTIRFLRELRSMRTKKRVKAIRRAFVAGCVRDGFRIVDWSIQGDHIHLIVEAHDKHSLSRGIQGFNVRVARSLNGLWNRRGTVFAERYHARELRTPREVRSARAYVMNNARRHASQEGEIITADWIDPYSSWAWFDGWRNCPKTEQYAARAGPEGERPVGEARSWLLRKGWRRHGLVSRDEIPGVSRRVLHT
jgi:REP element-mobilizing transposase RayT